MSERAQPAEPSVLRSSQVAKSRRRRARGIPRLFRTLAMQGAMSSMASMSGLPTDLVLEIFKFLQCPSELRYASTCKRYAIALDQAE